MTDTQAPKALPQMSLAEVKRLLADGMPMADIEAISAARVAEAMNQVIGRCKACGQDIRHGDDYEIRHAAYWHTSHTAGDADTPTETKTYDFAAHGNDWSGVTGQIEATDETDAYRKVEAWIYRKFGRPSSYDVEAVSGSDELGLHIDVRLAERTGR